MEYTKTLSKLISAILVICLPCALFAEPIEEILPPVNSLCAGLGFVGVGVPNDPGTVYWNPAGLASMDQMSVDFTVAAPSLESPGSWSFLVANSSSGGGGRFGIALIRRHVKRDDQTYKSFQFNTPLSYGFKAGKFPVGVTLKFISEQFKGSGWHYGLAFDVGTIWIAPSGFVIGFSCLNFSGSNLGAFERENWLGTSWTSPNNSMMFAAQTKIDRPFYKNNFYSNFGMGMKIDLGRKTPGLRAGYLERDGEKRWTVGFRYRNLKSNSYIEYALAANPDGWGQRAHFLTYGYSIKPSFAPEYRNPIW